ncbi:MULTISPECIES: hypothetical protein [unclassified Nocardioides]|uniref:hypothetical protein n=1 Tax=unclassified Nocardioides TaxID=2615069 RepID=UPI003014C27C
MPKFAPGETVWVSSKHLPGQQPFALMERKVLAVMDRSIVVDDRQGGTVKVSTRSAHPRSLGFLVLRVGDLATEPTLLDPLAKSVLQYLRLLISDTEIRMLHVRTQDEVREFMRTHGAAFSHVVLIGHGTSSSLIALGTQLSGTEVGSMLNAGDPKVVISLACSTGKTAFARKLSESPACRELVAPFSDAHGAAASLFLQTLLHKHLLMGHEFRTAFRIANDGLEGTHFRHWRSGVRQD